MEQKIKKKRWLILEEFTESPSSPTKLVCYGRKTGPQIDDIAMNYECSCTSSVCVKLFPNRAEYRNHIQEMRSAGAKVKHMVYG